MTQHYDAFISYRHTERDTEVAKEIQRRLEHFRIPSAIRERYGISRIGSVFRDQDELNIGMDLGEKIDEALLASDHLIIICSPSYNESAWCLREAETFIREKGYDHVHCVLSEGEPPDIFPEILRRKTVSAEGEVRETEPLACDYRISFRNAARIELPRLVSSMIGCSYDELVMRTERSRRRRLAAVLSAVSAGTIAAVSYLVWSLNRISDNYRQALISESLLLAEESRQALAEQDSVKALQLALSALPDKKTDRPVTDDALHALAEAAYAGKMPYTPGESFRIDLVNDISSFFTSPDGRYIICTDTAGETHTFDLETRSEAAAFHISDISVPSSPGEGSAGEMTAWADGDAVSVDYLSGTEIWRTPMKYRVSGILGTSHNGEYIACADSYAVQIMTADGTPFLSLPLPEDMDSYITGFCWSEDDSLIAVKLRNPSDGMSEAGIFEFETSRFVLLPEQFEQISDFCFSPDHILYVMSAAGDTASADMNSTIWRRNQFFSLSAWDMDQQVFQTYLNTPSAIELTRIIPGVSEVLACAGSTVYAYTPEGELLARSDCGKPLAAVLSYRDHILDYITADGWLGRTNAYSDEHLMQKSFPDQIQSVSRISSADPALERYYILHKGNISVYGNLYDKEIQLFEGEGFAQIPYEHLYHDHLLAVLSDSSLYLYDTENRIMTDHVPLDDGNSWHLLEIADDHVFLLKTDSLTGQYSVCSAEDHSVREICLLPAKDYHMQDRLVSSHLGMEEIIYFCNMHSGQSYLDYADGTLYLHERDNPDTLILCRPSSAEVQQLELPLPDHVRLLSGSGYITPSILEVSDNGRYLLSTGTDTETSAEVLALMDLETMECTLIPCGTHSSLTAFSEDCVLIGDEHGLNVWNTDGSLREGISFTGNAAVAAQMHDGSIYCVFPDQHLRIWSQGNIVRDVALSFPVNSRYTAGSYRFVFENDLLYLYCDSYLDVIRTGSDSSLPVFSAGNSMLEHTGSSFAAYSQDPFRQDGKYYPAVFPEYTVNDLLRKGNSRLEELLPAPADAERKP